MLKQNNGFTFVEVLIGFSLIMLMVTTIIPITTLLEKERGILSDRRVYSNKLHDELQPFLWEDKQLPSSYVRKVDLLTLTYTFSLEEELVKGCVEWINIKKIKEVSCLYGYP